jgi:hypothetical protein
MAFDWSKLGRTPPHALGIARIHAHHALQWVTRAARANLAAVPDDSHASVEWDAEQGALFCRPLPSRRGGVRVGLRIAGLALVIVRAGSVVENLTMDGKTDAATRAWIDSRLKAAGLRPASGVKLPYALSRHPIAGGAPYDLHMQERELSELSRWFGGAAAVLEEFTSTLAGLSPGPDPVVCWPHHFDMATVVRLEAGNAGTAKSIGVGVSPGDEYYPQPYVYLSPWPRPDAAQLPKLPHIGHWHTRDFVAAVATGDEILALADRGPGMLAFITGAFEIGRALLAKSDSPQPRG